MTFLVSTTFSTCSEQHQICKCCRLGFRPDHNSQGVLGTNLDGKRFSMYITVSKAYPQKDIGNPEKLIIDLIISKRVRFLFLLLRSAEAYQKQTTETESHSLISIP